MVALIANSLLCGAEILRDIIMYPNFSAMRYPVNTPPRGITNIIQFFLSSFLIRPFKASPKKFPADSIFESLMKIFSYTIKKFHSINSKLYHKFPSIKTRRQYKE